MEASAIDSASASSSQMLSPAPSLSLQRNFAVAARPVRVTVNELQEANEGFCWRVVSETRPDSGAAAGTLLAPGPAARQRERPRRARLGREGAAARGAGQDGAASALGNSRGLLLFVFPPQVMKLGNPEIARRLLQRGADPNLRDSTGFAAIHDAARAGFLDTLQTLLEFKADVNLEDDEGNLPLHLAAREGHARVVEFLARSTPTRLQHRNKRGHTACDLARLYQRAAVVRVLEPGAAGAGAAGVD
ncbi:PREDICTED: cyclin-dependent kinase 4 inhibitor C [Crocodylus porosus]|uniref:cyclin-dependent kinase 4 inhibitor C n=1 Tax=Crocodylus porosus TaxID=8502 RepID=UPI00093D1606|nr:PREDICTED: cyclin-dependent kinase 4 inhibitor C [Crocodylus porosus]